MFAKTSPRYSYRTPEKDFADRLEFWLVRQGYKVYREVRIVGIESRCRHDRTRTYGVADAAAIKGRLSHIIEIKPRIQLEVFNQVYRYRQVADFISVAAPNLYGAGFEQVISDTFGIGLIGVQQGELKLIAAPRRRYPKQAHLAEALRWENFERRKHGWNLVPIQPVGKKVELCLPFMLERRGNG